MPSRDKNNLFMNTVNFCGYKKARVKDNECLVSIYNIKYADIVITWILLYRNDIKNYLIIIILVDDPI